MPPPYGEAYQKAIAGSRLEVLKEAGHFPLEEQPDRAFKIVTDFLDQTD